MPDEPPLADRYSRNAAESGAVVAAFLERGGDPATLTDSQDLVAATVAVVLRGSGHRTIADLTAAAGIPTDFGRKVCVALGVDPAADHYEPHDTTTLELFDTARSILGEAQALELARVVGHSARRIAETTTSLFRIGIEMAQNDSTASIGTRADLAASYATLASTELPRLEFAITRTLRHHVADVGRQAWAPDETRSVTTRRVTIGFADLVGFTEWTRSASLEALSEVLREFEATVWAIAADTGIEVVKMIGDEVMLAAPSTPAALDAACRLVAAYREHGVIDGIRVGISAGEVISRSGDLFGSVVNEAARLVSAAPQGGILVTDEAASTAPGYHFGSVEQINAKGFRTPLLARPLRF